MLAVKMSDSVLTTAVVSALLALSTTCEALGEEQAVLKPLPAAWIADTKTGCKLWDRLC